MFLCHGAKVQLFFDMSSVALRYFGQAAGGLSTDISPCAEISDYMRHMGLELKNQHNWTYATPDIYLSDMHDENVILSSTGAFCVVDCDIRINTPELRQGGIRKLTTDI